jgi:hypothetical protein
MLDITQFYSETKQEPGHVDIILEPRLAKEYVHFDTLFFVNSKLINIRRSDSGWGGDLTHSLKRISAIKYILSEDKKKFRTYEGFCDEGIKRDFFDGDTIGNGYWHSSPDYRTVRLTTDKTKINLEGEIQSYYINKVEVINPPYLCPKTGILWQYRNKENAVFSDKFWLFRQIPKHKLVSEKNFFGSGKYLSVDREEKIWILDNEDHAYDADFLSNLPKTSFLSGKETISKRLGRNYRFKDLQDNRAFLLKQPKPPKLAIIKSAARYLRKRMRISPLRPSEKKFFQMIGALAHINNETLNRKKVYAA